MSWLVCGAVLPALLIALVSGYAMRWLAPLCGLVDRPGQRKVHEHATPLGGGLAIWLGLVAPFALGQVALDVFFPAPVSSASSDIAATRVASEQSASLGATAQAMGTFASVEQVKELVRTHAAGLRSRAADLWFLLAMATVVMLLGLADDRWGLDWRLRLSVQTAVAGGVVFGRGWQLTAFIDAPVITGLLSMVWIVGLINSFNMLDNMDGLSAGVATIAAILLAAVALLTPHPGTPGPQLFVAGFLFVLVGSLLGFLWNNRPPARLFMGDAGSYLVGFCLATVTLLATFSGQDLPRHSILAPLCILAVPLYDTVSVIWIRLRGGRSPFVGDKSHFSHRLVELGLTKTQAVLTIYLISAGCGLGSLVLYQVNTGGAVAIGLMVLSMLGFVAILESTARRQIGERK